MNAVDHVEEVPLRIDAGLVHAGEDLADEPLAGCSAVVAQAVEIGQQVAFKEREEAIAGPVLKQMPLDSIGRRPVAPAIRLGNGVRESSPESPCFALFPLLALIEKAKEEEPREFRHVLKGASAVRAP